MDERISGESRQSVVRNRKAFRPHCQTGWDEAVANHYVECCEVETGGCNDVVARRPQGGSFR
jgi:hypothetical protein